MCKISEMRYSLILTFFFLFFLDQTAAFLFAAVIGVAVISSVNGEPDTKDAATAVDAAKTSQVEAPAADEKTSVLNAPAQ